MKKIRLLLPLALSLVLLSACGDNVAKQELNNNDTNKAAAKVETATTPAKVETVQPTKPKVPVGKTNLDADEKIAIEYFNVYINGTDKEVSSQFVKDHFTAEIQPLYLMALMGKEAEKSKYLNPRIIETVTVENNGAQLKAVLAHRDGPDGKIDETIFAFMSGKISLALVANSTNADMKQVYDTLRTKFKTEAPDKSVAKTEDVKKPEEKKDIWTYYNDAKWSDDFKGLKTEIQKVVVSDKAPNKNDNTKFESSAVGIKIKLENTTDGVFTTYPDQARLVTSTGEQIEMSELMSESLGGEIEKGVIKEGNVIWYLKRGHAEDITWIKLKWRANVGKSSNITKDSLKEYDIEIKLK
jgi:hypothetical protein